MQSTGFICTPTALPSAASSFVAPVTTSRPSLAPRVSRRSSRAKLVALGAAPPPPPSNESDDEGEGGASGQVPKDPGSDAGDINPDASAEGGEVTADDILNSPAFLKKKLEIVQKELIEAKAALEQDTEAVKAEKDRYVRLAADFENFRRRSVEDLRKQDAKSTAKVCQEILGVLDNFDRAIKSVQPETEKEKAISSSYQAINKQLLDALVKLKVTPIDAIGSAFDPEMHEAIQRLESTEHPEDVVCAQYQRGYMIEQTLIRAAIVGVSSGPGPEAVEGENGNGAAQSGSEEGVTNGAAGSEVESGGQ